MTTLVYLLPSIKNVLPSKVGLPTEEENPSWTPRAAKSSPLFNTVCGSWANPSKSSSSEAPSFP